MVVHEFTLGAICVQTCHLTVHCKEAAALKGLLHSWQYIVEVALCYVDGHHGWRLGGPGAATGAAATGAIDAAAAVQS